MNEFDQLFLANFEELSLKECGRERCQPGKIVNFDIKDYHLFHYVLFGQGTFIFDGKIYHLKKGDIFYIPPQHTAKYFPSFKDPWMYTWIGFKGARSDLYLKRVGLSEKSPVFNDRKHLLLKPLFNELMDKYNSAKYLNIEILAVFMNIIYKMMTYDYKVDLLITSKQAHIRTAKQFIENNFQFKIRITDIADALPISSNYLANIFKEELGYSPKQFLTEYRIQKACQMLLNGDMHIKDIAKRVGYDNPLHFSAEFKRIKNVSPKMYREKNKL